MWRFFIKHKTEIMIMLDNDSTHPAFHPSIIPDYIEDCDDLPDLKSFNNWISNSPGIDDLMAVFGILAEVV